MAQRCDHLGFVTNDMERMLGFYTGCLGFSVTKEAILPPELAAALFQADGELRMVYVAVGDVMLELFAPVAGTIAAGAGGYHHWAFATGDREACVARLRAAGVAVIALARNGSPVYFVRDPDGNMIEIRD